MTTQEELREYMVAAGTQDNLYRCIASLENPGYRGGFTDEELMRLEEIIGDLKMIHKGLMYRMKATEIEITEAKE